MSRFRTNNSINGTSTLSQNAACVQRPGSALSLQRKREKIHKKWETDYSGEIHCFQQYIEKIVTLSY